MINIRNAEIVYYDNGEKNITVYFDFEDSAKKYYIVPMPHLVMATEAEVPVFSLTKYKSNEGGVRGVCTFDVELYVPQDASEAVKRHLDETGKKDYVQGQFDWASVNTFFKYVLEGEEYVVNMVPSMYGQNRVSFVILLKKDEDVTTFAKAFNSGGGSVSPFSIEYDMTSLTKLVGVRARVSYNASIAVEWQRTYKTEKDTWGNSRTVVSEVKKNLKQSGAGDVLVDPVEKISDETRQRVQDWAWATLEKMVADSVTIANAAATSMNPVESMASFSQNYQENEVIEWSVKSSDNLPMFDDELWAQLYHEVDLRQMVVNFNLVGNFAADSKSGVDKVDVTVMYKGQAPQTKTLQPTGNNSSFVYKAPGAFEGNNFIAAYDYKYVVYFKNPEQQPYISDVKTSSDTVVNITPALLGIQRVSFNGTNIPFTKDTHKFKRNDESTVDRLIIDFYFNRPDGLPNKTEQREMKENNKPVTFESFYVLPIENTYIYKLTYLMSDGSEIVIDPVRNFGADNSDSILVNFPLQDMTFSVNARKDGDQQLEVVLLDAEYIDEQSSTLKPKIGFEPWEVNFKSSFVSNPQKWEFRAIRNPDGAHYLLNGTLLYKDYEVDINNYRIPANKSSFTIFTDKEQASVAIDWNMVDWDKVANVEITLFQQEGSSISSERIIEILHPNGISALTDTKEVNKQTYPLLQSKKAERPRLIYNVSRNHDSPKFEYWMGVTYNQVDGKKLYLKTEKTDNLLYTLPPNGNSAEPHISLMSASAESLTLMKKPRRAEETQIGGK